jgi:uncharacterized peroxidase-related enzyme
MWDGKETRENEAMSSSSRIAALDPNVAEGKTKELLTGVNKMLGATPNLFRVAAQSAPTLEGMVAMFGATGKGSLNARTREAIAMAVAETNRCDYCLSAHTYLGKGAGLSEEELDRARDAASSDPKTNAVLKLSRSIVTQHGRVSEEDLASARRAGVTDAEALEVVTNVVLNIFTNYVNLLAETEIDFPVVRAR